MTQTRRVMLQAITATALAAFALTGPARAEYPDKPITFVVPYAAGGTMDTIVRMFADHMKDTSIIVENRPGGGTAIGAMHAAKADADGYTLLGSSSGMVTVAAFQDIDFDIRRDLTPVTQFYEGALAVLVQADLPVNSIAELIAYAKANPGKLNYGSSGIGSTAFLGVELMKMKAGLDIVHIPYDGSASLQTAMLNGSVDLIFDGTQSARNLIDSGKARIIAMTGRAPDPAFPDTPVVKATEALSDYVYTYWLGVHAPTGTSPEIIEKLNTDLRGFINDAKTQDRFKKMGIVSADVSASEFDAIIEQQATDMKALIEATGL